MLRHYTTHPPDQWASYDTLLNGRILRNIKKQLNHNDIYSESLMLDQQS